MNKKTALILQNARGGVRQIGRVRRKDFVRVFVPTIAGRMIGKDNKKGVYEFKTREQAQKLATKTARRAREWARKLLNKGGK
jgi:hypothetical protein